MTTDQPAPRRRKTMHEQDDPANYAKLSPTQQEAIQMWIKMVMAPAKTTTGPMDSYGLKHCFERRLLTGGYALDLEGWRAQASISGFYLNNGAMKGAMLAAGYTPVDEGEQNWTFHVRQRCPHRTAQGKVYSLWEGQPAKRKPDQGCPMPHMYDTGQAGPYAACQATDEELHQFAQLLAKAHGIL